MTTARKLLVNPEMTQLYHCISRCVRGALLFSNENAHRKLWVEERLQQLVKIFAIDVAGFSMTENQLHLLLRIDPGRAKAWSAEEVVRRWLQLCPLKNRSGKPLAVTPAWIASQAQESTLVAEHRTNLVDLGWFMKFLKEPISRRANLEDNCSGTFWEGRYQSIAILDEASLLATMAYIDLNPITADVAAIPETSPYTSIKARVDHVAAQGKLEILRDGSRYASQMNLEKGHWLFPIQDRRNLNGKGPAGLIRGLSLSGYLQLVNWSSRLIHPGKVDLPETVRKLLSRLQIDAAEWKTTLDKLVGSTRQVGSYFGSPDRLREIAGQRGCRYLRNITGNQTTLAPSDAD